MICGYLGYEGWVCGWVDRRDERQTDLQTRYWDDPPRETREEIHVWRHGENEAPILSTCIAAKVLEGGSDSVHQLRYSTLTRILVKI